MGLKYEFTGETKKWEDSTLHRIRRLSDGKLGGWIEKEENLSQEGNCWVDDKAKVYENAEVYGNAKVYKYAEVYGDAKVYGNAEVYDDGVVYGNAEVYDRAKVYGDAKICGSAKVYGNANVSGEVEVTENAQVYDNAYVFEYAMIYGNAQIYENAEVYGGTGVYGNAEIFGNAKIYDHAEVYGDAQVYGNAQVYGEVEVRSNAEICGYMKINGKKYANGKFSCDEDLSNDGEIKKVVQDFIYSVNDSNKLTTQTECDSIDEFFSEPVKNDIKLDTLIICSVDTKEPLIKLQKVEVKDKTEFKFIVDIINEDDDSFTFKSIIKSQDQLNQLIQQTVEALKQYPKFNKYVDDLEEYL